jgi:glyceraldehyde 3-phosphate dehydrogenase
MKFSATIAIAAVGSASAYSFSGTSLKAATSNGASMSMATGMGVNGFGRIGRLVTRIIMEDADCKLAAINAGSATPDYSESSISSALHPFIPFSF